MMNHSIKALFIGTTLVLAASGSWAQNSNTLNPTETTIGVTPQDANEAAQKAVPRADTGTLVRTEPSASDRANEMTEVRTEPSASNQANEVTEDTKNVATPPDTRRSTSTNVTVNNTGNNPGNRPARADRN